MFPIFSQRCVFWVLGHRLYSTRFSFYFLVQPFSLSLSSALLQLIIRSTVPLDSTSLFADLSSDSLSLSHFNIELSEPPIIEIGKISSHLRSILSVQNLNSKVHSSLFLVTEPQRRSFSQWLAKSEKCLVRFNCCYPAINQRVKILIIDSIFSGQLGLHLANWGLFVSLSCGVELVSELMNGRDLFWEWVAVRFEFCLGKYFRCWRWTGWLRTLTELEARLKGMLSRYFFRIFGILFHARVGLLWFFWILFSPLVFFFLPRLETYRLYSRGIK